MTGGEAMAPEDLAAWLRGVLGVPGPFRLTRLGGGNSNVTDLVSCGAQRWLLRRPPSTSISATANNLAREHRVLQAIAGRGVPAPLSLAYVDDPAVAGTPCLLLEFVDGVPLTTGWPPQWRVEAGSLAQLGEAALDALARVHAVDWQAAGLTGFGRPDGYLTRQVARWRGQYEANQVRELPHFGQVADWLQANQPAHQQVGLLHGDFHLDNCLFLPGPPVRCSAVIDWELATIGDPLVDLGLLLAFWGPDRPARPAMAHVQGLTRDPHAPSRAQLAARYEQLTGRSTVDIAYYMTLALFKLAAIVEGAFAAYVAGAVDSPYAQALGEDVPALLQEAYALTRL